MMWSPFFCFQIKAVQQMGQLSFYNQYNRNNTDLEVLIMKGYIVHNGYMGYIGGGYQLFASESDYREYFED